MNIFEPIIRFEKGYSINRLGEIYSNKHKRLLKPYDDGNGYLRVELYLNDVRHNLRLHRLLALQFLPNPNNYTIIDHIDQNRSNNSLDNLRWTTHSVNNRNRKIILGKSGYPNIYINDCGNFCVRVFLDKKTIFNKTFKTIDEALSERDWAFDFFGLENNCYK
jgi:hypothetical protein